MPVRPSFLNKERFQSLLDSSPYDAVIATSFKNVYYLSGALIETQRRIPLRLAIVVWPKKGEPVLIVGDIEESLARRESHLPDVRSYVEFRETPVAALVDALKDKGLEKGRIGIELEHLVADYYNELEEQAPHASLQSVDRFFDNVRKIKTLNEVELMGDAARSTERAIQGAYQQARAGISEKELALNIIQQLLRSSADSIRFMVLGAGENSVYSHHIPTNRVLAPGDTVRLDVGAYFSGYASDIARMAFVEAPSKAQLDLYQRMIEIHRETITAVRPGNRACDVYHTCQRAFESRGYELRMPHVGHGFGVDGGHEEPLLQPLNEEMLEPGMVVAVEPVHHDPELGGFHVEDLLLVTEEGAELLSDQIDISVPFIIQSEAVRSA